MQDIHQKIDPVNFEPAEDMFDREAHQHGWQLQAIPYHKYFSQSVRHYIAKLNNPTSLYIRTLPDRILCKGEWSPLVEIKNLLKPKYANIAIEALPFIVQRKLYTEFEIDTLYAFVAPTGIYMSHVKDIIIFKAIIPEHRKNENIVYWRKLLQGLQQEAFPNLIIEEGRTYGSHDCFCLSRPSILDNMGSIKNIITILTKDKKTVIENSLCPKVID